MSLNEEERKIVVNLELDKALMLMNQAEKNAEIELWDVVANRLYYSLFHGVSALLIHDHHNVSTHKGAVMMFGQYYVMTGVFSAEHGKFYSKLQTMREKADYNCNWSATEELIKPMIEPAKDFIGKIKDIINEL